MNARLATKMQNIRSSGIRKLFDLAHGLSDVISLGIGEPDFECPAHIKQAAIESIKSNPIKYTPNTGIAELREAITEYYLENMGIEYDPFTDVLISIGASEGIGAAVIAHLNPGDEVLLFDPGFLAYEPLTKIANGNVKFIPLYEENRFKPDIDQINESVTKKTRLLILNYPTNPTGMTLDKADIKAIAEIVEDNRMLVISDDVYSSLLFDNREHTSIASFTDNAIIVESFSKRYAMTGWRIGYILAKKELLTPILRVHQYMIASVPLISQYAALAALKGPQEIVDQMCLEYQERRDLVMREIRKIDGIRCLKPEGTFYAFPNVSGTGFDGDSFSELMLQKAGVIVVPGGAFGSQGKNNIRISFSTSKENIIEAFERIKTALETI